MQDDSVDKREHYDEEVVQYDEVYFEDPPEYHPLLVARDIVVEAFAGDGDRRILDMGCGSGGIVVPLLEAGHDVYGFDFSAGMVESARSNLENTGYDSDRIQQADVRDGIPFKGSFDGVIAIGLFPHLADRASHLRAVHDRLEPDGRALVQFRNNLFSIFSYNEYTYDFIWGTLLSDLDVSDEVADQFDERLRRICDLDESDDGRKEADKEGDFSNPLTIQEPFHEAGFAVRDMMFYHYHPLPPEYESEFPAAYERLASEIEDATDWRGHLMASAFVVDATPES